MPRMPCPLPFGFNRLNGQWHSPGDQGQSAGHRLRSGAEREGHYPPKHDERVRQQPDRKPKGGDGQNRQLQNEGQGLDLAAPAGPSSADEGEVPLNRMPVRRFTQDRWRRGCTPGSTTLRPTVMRRALVPVPVMLSVLLVACSGTSTPASPQATAGKLINQGIKAQSSGNPALALKDYAGATGGPTLPTPTPTTTSGSATNRRVTRPMPWRNITRPCWPIRHTNRPCTATVETATNPTLAIFEYNQLLRLNPNDANASFNLGLLLIAQNQSAVGHTDLKKAIETSPALAKRLPTGITA